MGSSVLDSLGSFFLFFKVLAVLMLAFLRASCFGTPEPPELTLSPAAITIEAEDAFEFAAMSTDPDDTLGWSSSDTGVAPVFEGQVTGLAPGVATITVTGSNSGLAQTAEVTVLERTTPRFPPDAPFVIGPGPITNAAKASLSGLTDPNVQLEIAGGEKVVKTQADESGGFTRNVPLHLNRLNTLYVTAIGPTGLRSAPAAVQTTQDSEDPFVAIDFPEDGSTWYEPSVDVAGRISDLLSGAMALSVTVNGESADINPGIGTNGTFFKQAFPLALGANVITAEATDAAGNTATAQITVTRATLTGPRLSILSGNAQTGGINSELADPLVVQVLDESMDPVPNCTITWRVTRSDGVLANMSGVESADQVIETMTDAQGQTSIFWTLGSDAGMGNNRLIATADCALNSAAFCASAMPGPASLINIGSGNNQRVAINSPTPAPLKVWVSDGNNGIPNVPVTFTLVDGEGVLGDKFGGAKAADVMTSATGHADIPFELGEADGFNVVEADFPGNTGDPARFTINAVYRDGFSPTTFSGMVIDNASRAVGGAHCVLHAGGETFEAESSDEGFFSFDEVPPGFGELEVNGMTATLLNGDAIPAGSFPPLHFEFQIIENVNNTIGMPIILPPLNPVNKRMYDGTQDIELTVEGVEGLKFTIKAGSMRLADGSEPTPQNPMAVALNQVHLDDVPMPFPDGTAPPFAWTLKPGGATFDPPVSIEFPNMTGLAPGAVTDFLNFNHDTGRFEVVATGTVSPDGSLVKSDPGSGIATAGWGSVRNPVATGKSKDRCGVVGVVLCTGGTQWQDWLLPGDLSDLLEKIATASRQLDPEKVRARVVRASTNTGVQLLTAGLWIKQIKDGCDDSKILIVGHSLGGDTVRQSNNIPIDRRIALDPISRDQVLPLECQAYQRQEIYPAPPNTLVMLATDLTTEQVQNCAPECSIGRVGSCLRGYMMTGAEHITLANTNHNNIVGRAQSTILHEVELLLEQVKSAKSAPRGVPPNVYVNETFTLMCGGQTFQCDDSGFFYFDNVSAPDNFGLTGPGSPSDLISDDYVRMTGVGQVDGDTWYVYSEPFRITQGQTYRITDLTFTQQPPPVPVSIVAAPDDPTLVAIGATTTVRVTGLFADNSVEDLTGADAFTTYRSSNERIATAGIDGVVTAIRPGTVFITATNMGAVSVTAITVAPDATLTAVIGSTQTSGAQPVEGADVRMLNLGGMDATDATGAFRIVGVPSDQGDLAVVAQKLDGSGALVGISSPATPIADGDTDVGAIVMQTLCEIAPGDCTDSDNDGAIDSLESGLGFVVGNPDTNNNTIPDGLEDTDGDGLSVLAETLLGTSDGEPDSDMDGLTDSEEVLLGTDPADPDGDGDGLLDGEDDDPFNEDLQVPTVTLLQPVDGTDLVEHETIAVRVRVVDNGRIEQVVFKSDGNTFDTIDLSKSGGDATKAVDTEYQADFTVPAQTMVTLEVEATDTNMNTGTTGSHVFDIIDDPLTTVIGTVVDNIGNPVENAEVSVDSLMSTTLANGTFSIPNVPTKNGDIVVTARTAAAVVPRLSGRSAPTTPVAGATTDVGQITLLPGSLFPGRKYPIEGQPSDAAAGDFDEDGNTDLAVAIFVPADANQLTQRLALYFGNGDGTFTDPQYVDLSTRQVRQVEAVDLDGDMHLDLIAGQSAGSVGTMGEIRVLFGDGTGAFGPAVVTMTSVNNKVTSMAIADFDEDTELDLIASTDQSGSANSLEIFFGDGTGAFTSGGLLDTLGKVVHVTAGDLNKDNAPDIVAVNEVNITVSFLLNKDDGTGTFEPSTTAMLEGGGFRSPRFTAIADVNEDTNPDIVAVFQNGTAVLPGGGVVTALGNGDGTFQAQTGIKPVASWAPVHVTAEDVDDDTTVDLIVTASNGGTVTTLIGNGDNTYEPPIMNPGGAQAFFSIANTFDNDTTKDLAILNRVSNDVLISFGDGDGNFTPAPDSVPLDDLAQPVDVIVDFLDGDSIRDVVSVNHRDDQLAIALGSAMGLQAPQLVNVGDAPASVVSGLFNNDGDTDLIVANQDSDDLSVLLGNGDGTFQAPQTIALAADDEPATLATGLLNNDAFLDLVVTLEGANAVKVLLGNGDGTFQTPVSYATNGTPRELTLADLDGDTHLDALVGIDGTTVPSIVASTIDVLYGNGDGTFDAATTLINLGSLTTAQSIAVANLNGDTDHDFVVFMGPTDPVDGQFKAITTYPILVVLADGLGGYTLPAQIPVNTDPGPGRVYDIDGDGALDIITSSGQTSDISVFLGNGDGTFQAEQRYNVNEAYGTASGPVFDIGDMDGDMQDDVTIVHNTVDLIQVLKQIQP